MQAHSSTKNHRFNKPRQDTTGHHNCWISQLCHNIEPASNCTVAVDAKVAQPIHLLDKTCGHLF